MPKLQIAGFDGEVPRTSPTTLQPNQATLARNVKLYAGELRTWNGPVKEYTCPIPDVKTIYELFYGPASLHNNLWLTWNKDVDVAPGPSADVSDVRAYYTGDGVPKKTNWALANSGAGANFPKSYLKMGVPAPTVAPSVQAIFVSEAPIKLSIDSFTRSNDSVEISYTEDGVAGTRSIPMSTGAPSDDYSSVTMPYTETRAYVYTYVSTFGSLKEESAPSPASSLIDVDSGENVRVSGFATAPTNGYNITHLRIYRTLAGDSGAANYVFVAELPIGTTTYTDSKMAVELGESLATVGWTPPPDNMVGLTNMPNGVLAGFVNNTVYFSEPYYPHAWPNKYALSVPYTIIGLAAYGNTLVVMTDYYPYAISGVYPGQMTVEKIPLPEPCISKRSIAVDQQGVVYASPNGLVGISSETRAVITKNLFRHEEWAEFQPETLIGAIFNGRYYGFYESSARGSQCMVLSRDDIPALSFVTARATAVRTDAYEGHLYYVAFDTNAIYHLDADALNPSIYEWQSKRFVTPHAVSFSALKVDIATEDIIDTSLYIEQTKQAIEYNQTLFNNDLKGVYDKPLLNQFSLNGSILKDLPTQASSRWAQITIYADRREVVNMSVLTYDPVRLPPFKGREIEVKITGNTPVRSVTLASSVQELYT